MASKQHPQQARHPQVISLLREDHREVERLFERYRQTHQEAEKDELAEQLCKALTAHAQLEEEIFYPEVAMAIDEPLLVDEARVEHKLAKLLISEIEAGEPRDPHVQVLCEIVHHHVREEESELFPKVEAAPIEFDELYRRMLQRKEELMVSLDLQAMPERRDDNGEHPRKSHKAAHGRRHQA